MISKNSTFVLYRPFIDAYMKGHPEVATCLRHYNALAEWNRIKSDEPSIKASIEAYLQAWRTKREGPVDAFERKRTMSSDDETQTCDPLFDPDFVDPVVPTFSKRDAEKPIDDVDSDKPWVIRGLEKARARVEAHLAQIEAKRLARSNRIKAPAQTALEEQIKEIASRIENLTQVKNMGLSTEEASYSLKKLMRQKKERSTELSLLRSKQRAGLRYRQRRKKNLQKLCDCDPEVATELLKLHKPSTIPVPVDNVCPDMLRTIEEIARIGGVSDSHSHSNVAPVCSSLEEVRDRVKERGYEIRRSTLFYRLIPAGAFSEDGKKHIDSTAVRLRKLQGIQQIPHEDCHFVSASLRHIRDLAGTFGNDCVLYLMQDTKASVRIGRQAGRGHSPLMMRLDYQSTSAPCQLKPTVYASCLIDEKGLVTNAGPTYVAIRSAKYDRPSMDSDEIDFDRVVKMKESERTARNHIGEIKPIIIMHVDRLDALDYTRFPKTLLSSMRKFKKYNLDAFILVSQAPGQALFNTVQRRLAPLSHDLSGLVLPPSYFGTHLNIIGLTVDADLEKINAKRTGELLADIWKMNMIDHHPVIVEYIDPPESACDIAIGIDTQFTLDCIIDQICDEDEEIPLHQRLQRSRPTSCLGSTSDSKFKPIYDIDEYWCATHVFQTQYTIQIIRCTKTDCCGPWRSNYIQVFPHRFLPPPVPFHRSSHGVRLEDIRRSFAHINPISPYYGTLFQRIQFHGIVMRQTQNQSVPFDAYCPSVQKKLHARLCSICKQYIPSLVRLRKHYRVHQQRYASLNRVDGDPGKEEDLADDDDAIDTTDLPSSHVRCGEPGVFAITDLIDWLKSDFEDDPVVETKTKSTAANAMAMIRKEKQATALVQPVATIAVDEALKEIKVEQDPVRSESDDDLNELIDAI